MGMSMLRDNPKMYFQSISVFGPLRAGIVYGLLPCFVKRQLCLPPPLSSVHPWRDAIDAMSLRRRGALPLTG